MKKSILVSSALIGLFQTTYAAAGPDFNQIHITRKNQLAHLAKTADTAKLTQAAKRCVGSEPVMQAPARDGDHAPKHPANDLARALIVD